MQFRYFGGIGPDGLAIEEEKGLYLKDTQCTTHISFGKFQQRLLTVFGDVHALNAYSAATSTPESLFQWSSPFGGDDFVDLLLHLVHRQRTESETGAAGLDCRRNLIHIVADNAESHVARVLFNHWGWCVRVRWSRGVDRTERKGKERG